MNSSIPQTARITTPQSKDSRSDVDVEEIPLPPSEQWAELDNSGGRPSPMPTDAQKTAAREIARLDFDGPVSTVVSLDHSFTHAEFGSVVSITVRRLTVGEVGDILDGRPANAPDMFDIYAVMTGFPAPILRGLIDVDGEKVTGACFDFLPRLFRPAPKDA